MSSLEFRSSEPLDQAASQVNSGSDSITREVQNQFSSVASVGKDAAMAAMPGTDAMAGLGAIPAGAEQAVSPLINMITKMPGHIGLFSSFFEALGAFFGPQLEALSQIGSHLGMTLGLDHSLLGSLGGNHLVSALNAFKPEHFGLNISLLPGNAPFFGQIGGIGSQLSGHLSGSFNSDLLSSKLNTSLGQGEPFSQQAFGSNALNVSGSGSMAKLQFEGQGHLSGPGLSANTSAPQVAGNNRLFSDSIGSAGHNLNAQSMAQSQSLPTQPSASSLNVGSSTFGEPINNDLLAMGNQSDSFQSTVGSAKPSIETVKGGAENLGGLKAKSLTLDGHNGNLKADALDNAHALDNKVVAKHDSITPKADHAVKHDLTKVANSHKLDHVKPEPKAEARTHKTFDRTSHSIKTSNHHASQNTAKAVANNKPQVEAQQQELNPQEQFEQQQLEQQQMQQQQEVAQNNQPLAQNEAQNQTQSANSLDPRSYTIRSGDNLWNIAKDNLGDATKWNDIYKMNADVLGANPELIRPGTTIQLPGAENANIASATTPGAAGQYSVQSGDTLWDIAHDRLGDATKWGDIYKANSELIGSNPGMIHPGQQLSIGTVDPSNQLVSASGAGQNLTSAAPGQMASAAVPPANINVDVNVQTTAEAPIESYGAEAGMPQDMQAQSIQSQSMQTQSSPTMSNYEAMPVQRINQLPDPASLGEKVLPAKAQPDVLIQPAHAAAPGQFESVKPAVNSNLANDMLSFLKKRR